MPSSEPATGFTPNPLAEARANPPAELGKRLFHRRGPFRRWNSRPIGGAAFLVWSDAGVREKPGERAARARDRTVVLAGRKRWSYRELHEYLRLDGLLDVTRFEHVGLGHGAAHGPRARSYCPRAPPTARPVLDHPCRVDAPPVLINTSFNW